MLKKLPIFLCLLTLQLPAADLEPSSKKMTTHTNRLAQETSPYLLQHATNPVDWYPWGEEAFAKARKENKLIFLSSGYSTCHWCHVMERESFKNEEIAALINKYFISIKLDREERPDVDQIYMTAHSAMSGGSGGWPLNMFLLPDLKPVYGGTYFPPTSRQGRPGFPQILEHLGTAWEKNPADLTKSATDFTTKLNDFLKPDPEEANDAQNLNPSIILPAARERLMGMADHENGGLGQAPKFPQVSTLRFLLHSGEKDAVNFVLKTCDVMQDAGIHDQIGGGFHRYATDEKWLIPHFEKMLYDQAQLIDLYLDAALLSDNPKKAATYNHTARKTARYILDEMTDENGGFYSAQDAQSEGKEGKYFCWTTAELKTLLTEDEFTAAQKHYGLTDKGNFLDFSDPEALPNLNILSIIVPTADLSEAEQTHLATAQVKMTATRKDKVPPMTDQKILASWNGLTIGALARAAHLLSEPAFLEAAEKAHHFITGKMWNEETQHLHHCSCDGKLDSLPQAESHLYLLRGTRQLYEATLDPQYLTFAIKLADTTVKNFHDDKNGGFYNSAPNPNLIMRLKGDYDGATPTVSSVAALEFLLLAEITGRADYQKIGQGTLTAHHRALSENPSSLAEMLVALPLLKDKPASLVLTKDNSPNTSVGRTGRSPLEENAATPDTATLYQQLLTASFQTPSRHLIRLGQSGPVNDLSKNTPTAKTAQAILCKNKTCLPAITKPEELKALLTQTQP